MVNLGISQITKCYLGANAVPQMYFGDTPLLGWQPANIVAIGASLIAESFGVEADGRNSVLESYCTSIGWEGTQVYGRGVSGSTTNGFATRLTSALAAFPDDNTLFILDIGGGNVTAWLGSTGIYNAANDYSAAEGEIDAIRTVINGSGRANRIIPMNITFRTYTSENAIFDDEALGAKPFWDNIFAPRYAGIPTMTGGNAVVNLNTWIKARWSGFLATDGVHVFGRAKTSLACREYARQIIARAKAFYYSQPITDTPRAAVTDYAAIVSQSSAAIVDDTVFPYRPNNFMSFSNVDECNSFTTTLRTPTGHPFCTLATATNLASWSTSGIGRSTSVNNISVSGFDDYDTLNEHFERTKVALSGNIFFNNGYLQFNLSGLMAGNYRAGFSCARAANRSTRCTHVESGANSTMTANTATPWGSLDFTVSGTTATLRFASATTGYGDLSCLTLRKL